MELMRAAIHNHIDRARELLDDGIDIDTQDTYGNTALMCALIHGHTDTGRLLLDRGADLNIPNRSNHTALMLASILQRIEAVRLLLSYGANPNIQDRAGNTAYTLSNNGDIREILRSYIANHGKSIYQMKDRSREYMSSVYSDISITWR